MSRDNKYASDAPSRYDEHGVERGRQRGRDSRYDEHGVERGRQRGRDSRREREPSLAGTARQSHYPKAPSVIHSTAESRHSRQPSVTPSARTATQRSVYSERTGQSSTASSATVRPSSRKPPLSRSGLSLLNPGKEGFADPHQAASEVGTAASISTYHQGATEVGMAVAKADRRRGIDPDEQDYLDAKQERAVEQARERLEKQQGSVTREEKEQELRKFAIEAGNRTMGIKHDDRASSQAPRPRSSVVMPPPVDRPRRERASSRGPENRMPDNQPSGPTYQATIQRSSTIISVRLGDGGTTVDVEIHHRSTHMHTSNSPTPNRGRIDPQFEESESGVSQSTACPPRPPIEYRTLDMSRDDHRSVAPARDRSVTPLVITDDFKAGLRRVRRGSVSHGDGGGGGGGGGTSSREHRQSPRTIQIFPEFKGSESGAKTMRSDASARPERVGREPHGPPPSSSAYLSQQFSGHTQPPSDYPGSPPGTVIDSRPPRSDHTIGSSRRSSCRFSERRER
ncbi:hypothetical protein SBOR_6474 [Sclerotinia borealis F-4128]|uniref:Uncharacterized protein n=1 Tax=Sclerotinia borealis (strain F-4128) TaxID=1432307 RepID=W9C8R4_SCLBF|nr:hypothetical protein SBOR_6474 [Sclerotinia borealis F-4128]